MKKRISSFALAGILTLQLCSVGMEAKAIEMSHTPPASAIKDTLEGFKGVVFERKVTDEIAQTFKITLYAYDFKANGMYANFEYNPDIISPYTTTAVANEWDTTEFVLDKNTDSSYLEYFASDLGVAVGYEHYRNGSTPPTKKVTSIISQNGYLTYPATSLDVQKGLINLDIGRNVSFASPPQYYGVTDNAFYPAVTSATVADGAWAGKEDFTLGYGIVSVHFKVNEGYTLDDVTTDVIHPWYDENRKDAPIGAAASDGNNTSTDIYYAGFPTAPAPSVTEITGAQAIAITAPVAGATPQATIAAGNGYTGTISWEPDHSTFAHATEYIANVVLTADGTHKFAAGATAAVASAASVNGNTISGDVAGNTLTFAATFKATAAATADAPTINTQPQGGTITAGESHTLTVNASVTDGGTLSYEWFSQVGTAGAVAIADSNKASIAVTPAETTSYYCVVTNTTTGATATTNTETVAVTVNPAITTISEIALALTAPVGNATAGDATTTTTGVTVGTVEWKPTLTNNTFAYDQIYTATIPVTAKEGFEIATGVTVTGLTGATYENGNVTVTFDATGKNPDIATVDTAINTIQDAKYADLQANIADEAAALAKAKTLVEALNVNSGTTVTVNAGTYTEPTAGTEGAAAGTDGSYTFTVTVAKGDVTKTTTDLTLTITATPYVAPGQTDAPAFENATVTKTSVTQTSVDFTLTNADATATYAVYADAQSKAIEGYSVNVVDTTLTLSHDSDVAAGTYHITATGTDTTESPSTPVTVNAYVEPALSGTVSIGESAVVGTELTAKVTDSNATVFAYQWKSGADNVGNGTDSYTPVQGDIGKAITCEVTAEGYTGTLTSNGLTVTDVVAPPEEVIPPTPTAPDTDTTVEAPATTTGQTAYEFSYKDAETTLMGKVSLARVDGNSFDLNTPAAADITYKMVATAEAGFQFANWATTRRAVSIQGNTITGTQAELAAYSAVFAPEGTSTVAPKLSQMTIAGADKSVLLRADHSRDGFDSAVTDYKVYLMPDGTGFTLNMAIQAPTADQMNTVVTVDGAEITATPVAANGLTTYTYTKEIVTTNGDVKVVLTNGGQTTTYTIAVAKVSAKPQIVMDVTGTTSGVYELAVNLENTIANEFTFSLKLDATAFAGFTDNTSTELTADGAMTAIAAQLVQNSAFEVVKATYDVDTNALVVAMAAKDNSYVDCTAKTQIATLKFLTTDNQSATMENLKKLTIDSTNLGDSALTDQRFEGFIETTADGATGLIIINLPNEMLVAGFVNSLMKADVQASIATITIKKDGTVVATINPAADRSFSTKLEQGTYTVEIALTNYVSKEVTVAGVDAAMIGAIALMAGDVNGSGTVTVDDRAALINLLFTSVTAGAEGDIDGDGRVNGSDLGYLLANIK